VGDKTPAGGYCPVCGAPIMDHTPAQLQDCLRRMN